MTRRDLLGRLTEFECLQEDTCWMETETMFRHDTGTLMLDGPPCLAGRKSSSTFDVHNILIR